MVQQAYDLISPVPPEITLLDDQEFSPIIFLHGLFDSRKTWKKTAPLIARKTGRKAYLLDARNNGDSPRTEKMDLYSLTDDVLEFMDEQNIPKAIIVGSSMGAKTGINLALNHSSRVDMLVIEDMSPKNLSFGQDTLAWKIGEGINFLLNQVPPGIDEGSAKRILFEEIMSLLPAELVNVENFRKHFDVDMLPFKKVGNAIVADADIDASFRMLKSNPYNQNFPESNLVFLGNSLFLFGSNSLFDLENDPSIRKLFPRAIVKKIEGGSHLLHLDSPEEFVNMVASFISLLTIAESKY